MLFKTIGLLLNELTRSITSSSISLSSCWIVTVVDGLVVVGVKANGVPAILNVRIAALSSLFSIRYLLEICINECINALKLERVKVTLSHMWSVKTKNITEKTHIHGWSPFIRQILKHLFFHSSNHNIAGQQSVKLYSISGAFVLHTKSTCQFYMK